MSIVSNFALCEDAGDPFMSSDGGGRCPAMKAENTTALLEALVDPAILVDGERRMVAANGAARELFGDLVIGDDLSMALRHPAALEAVSSVLAGAPAGTATVADTVPVQRVFEMHVAALPAGGGAGTGNDARALCLLRDVTVAHEAERMRADFVANVSHELRSPLSSLIGFIETLQNAAHDDPEAQARFLAIMDGEAKRMARLVDDLLSLSRVEAGEHIPPTGAVDLAGLLHEVTKSVAIRAAEKGTEVVLALHPGLPTVPGERDELLEVFHNLIDNAVKYGPADAPVTVTVRQQSRIPDIGDPGVAVAVTNQGDIIAPEHLPRLTERFYRIDKGRSREMGGTGLGLAIVKHIVNHHRGRLTIASSAEAGNTFTVFLPCGAPRRPE